MTNSFTVHIVAFRPHVQDYEIDRNIADLQAAGGALKSRFTFIKESTETIRFDKH